MSCGPGRRRRIQEAAVGFEILGFELAYLSSIGLPSTRIIAIKGGRYEGLGSNAAPSSHGLAAGPTLLQIAVRGLDSLSPKKEIQFHTTLKGEF